MKQTLSVEFKNNTEKNYQIHITDDSFLNLIEEINTATLRQKILFVVSKKVYSLYKCRLNLSEKEILVIPDGEKEKNFKNYTKILKKALELGLTRKDVMIALGGGVIGDLTGFAASSYMRGIDYIQVPTTLLAMVDSSVGGKTAINMGNVKNLVGTFYQPKAVFINTNFLNTLDEKQFRSGLGEILKYAFIEENCGYKHMLFLMEYLTLCTDKLVNKDSLTVIRVIEYCLKLKISIVNQDEKETGLRQVLNLGHTLAHALESKTKYKRFTHGEAVAYGMHFIFDWAYSKNEISYSYYRMSKELLSKYGFEKSLDLSTISTPQEFVDIIKHDKKALLNKITFIVPCDKKKVKNILLEEQEVLKMF